MLQACAVTKTSKKSQVEGLGTLPSQLGAEDQDPGLEMDDQDYYHAYKTFQASLFPVRNLCSQIPPEKGPDLSFVQ